MHSSRQVIENEFRETAYTSDMVNEYEKLFSLLENSKLLHLSLIELEKLVAIELEKKNLISPEGLIIPKLDVHHISHDHVLSELASTWAQENQFNRQQRIYCISKDELGKEERSLITLPAVQPVIIGILSANLFNAFVLALGFSPKDVGAGPSHGEFSHFIQLFMANHANNLAKILTVPLTDLIKHAGDYINVTSRGETPWSIIFDSPPSTDNFHNADFINHYLAETIKMKPSSSQMFPCLSALLKGRMDKRDPQFRDHPSFFPKTLINEETIKKYLQKPGIIINEAIYFPTSGRSTKYYIYDDITHESNIYRKVINDLKLTVTDFSSMMNKTDQSSTLIKNLIKLCEVQDSKFQEIQESLMDMKTQLMKLEKKNDQILRHRDIIQLFKEDMSLIKTFKKETAEYYASIVSYAIDTLQMQNKKDLIRKFKK